MYIHVYTTCKKRIMLLRAYVFGDEFASGGGDCMDLGVIQLLTADSNLSGRSSKQTHVYKPILNRRM